jgi:hypothetical protein
MELFSKTEILTWLSEAARTDPWNRLEGSRTVSVLDKLLREKNLD